MPVRAAVQVEPVYAALGIGGRTPVRAAGSPRAGAAPAPWFDLRDGFRFHQGHAWVRPGEGDVVLVGMDDFAQKLLGRPAALRLPAVGTRLRPGERAWEVQADSRSVPMISPVEGEVVERNGDVLRFPDLVTRDPYEAWLLKVRVPDAKAIARNLLSGRVARAWMEDTVERLRQMTAGELGIVMPDGGFPVHGFARILAPERWDEVARQLLLSE